MTLGTDLASKMGIVHYDKSEFISQFSQSLDKTKMDMSVFTNPQSRIYNPNLSQKANQDNKAQKSNVIITSLNEAYSDYTLPDGDPLINGNQTNLGYTGCNPEVYESRYDTEKEGFVRYLRKVQADNPNDQGIHDKVEEMVKDYNEMMAVVGNNPRLYEIVMKNEKWDINGTPNSISYSGFSGYEYGRKGYDTINPATAKALIDTVEKQSDVVINVLQNKGYSKEDIQEALSNSWRNDSLYRFIITNSQTGQSETIDFTALTNPTTNDPILEKHEQEWNSHSMEYTLLKFQKNNGIDINSAEAKKYQDHLSHYGGSTRGAAYDTSTESVMVYHEHLKQVASLSVGSFRRVHELSNKLMGMQLDTSGWDGKSTSIDATQHDVMTLDNSGKTVLSNVIMADFQHKLNTALAHRAQMTKRSQVNDYGSDYSENFSYYSGTEMKDFSDSSYGRYRIKQSGNSGSSTYTSQQLSDKITAQLNDTPSYSGKFVGDVNSHYEKEAASVGGNSTAYDVARGDSLDRGTKLDEVSDTPIGDVVYSITSGVTGYMSQVVKRQPNYRALIAKRMKYKPYDYNAQKPVNNTASAATVVVPKDKELKDARQMLLGRAMGTIAAEDEATSQEMRKDFLKRWDYTAGEKTPDGATATRRVHSGPNNSNGDQRALFNTRFFAIKNSEWSDRFEKSKQQLQSTTTDPECSKELELFHACSRASAGSILGRDKGWFMGDQYTKAGKMLGPGAYFAFKAGKSSVYCGNTSYANRNSAVSPGEADGVYIECTVMRGSNYTKSGSTSKTYTSSSQDMSSGLNDWEMAVRDNALILPHHFVDVSCRCLGRNISRDSQGNYLDSNGNPAWDKYGANLDMK